jgi:hypothetical protein
MPNSVLVRNEGNFTIKDYTMENIKVVELSQDSALLTSKFVQKGKYQGKDYSTRGYSSSVWVKRGGKWLCAFSLVTASNRLYAPTGITRTARGRSERGHTPGHDPVAAGQIQAAPDGLRWGAQARSG